MSGARKGRIQINERQDRKLYAIMLSFSFVTDHFLRSPLSCFVFLLVTLHHLPVVVRGALFHTFQQ